MIDIDNLLSSENNDKYAIKTVGDYCKLIIKGGAKEFISNYDYYNTLFLPSYVNQTSNIHDIEKEFIFLNIKLINSTIEMIENEVTEELPRLTMINEYQVSYIFLILKLSKVLPQEKKQINPYPRIFNGSYAYNVFDTFRQTVSNDLADFSFVYRKMLIDNLIFEGVGNSEFCQWLNTNYEIYLEKTKQLHLCTTEKKEQLYSIIKSSIQQE